MKPATCSLKPRDPGLRTVPANSAVPSGSNCWQRAQPRSSSEAVRTKRASALVPSHPLEHLLDMRDRRFRLDAMAQIEDQPPVREVYQHVVDSPIECGAA